MHISNSASAMNFMFACGYLARLQIKNQKFNVLFLSNIAGYVRFAFKPPMMNVLKMD
jgi:hypothetical protein